MTDQNPQAQRTRGELVRLVRGIRQSWKDLAQAIDPRLQPVGAQSLVALLNRGEMRASDLAEAMLIDKSVLSRQVTLLEDLGLIERRVDPDDARARILLATEHARQRLAEVPGPHQDRVLRELRSWTDAELKQFARHLDRLNRALSF